MADAFIVSAVRSPVGRKGGDLSQVHPADLGAHVIKGAVERAGIDPGAVDDVIFGCVDAMGAQFGNVARTAWLSAGFPEHVPGTTIDRQCGSSQQAAHFAAQGAMAGIYDLVVAGGVEIMSLVPIACPGEMGAAAGMGEPYSGQGWRDRYGDQEISQFRGAELIAEKWDISRQDMEEFALRSHQRAARATEEGLFEEEIVPYGSVTRDQGPRPDTTLEKMAALSVLTEGGRMTAAAASQISDGASALVIASAAAVERYGLTPLARFHTMTVVGSDPVYMLTGPIPATQAALKRAGLSIDDIDLFEINEAFAPVVLAWAKETGASLEKTNVLGGAIALGHPLGATGGRLMTTLVHHLKRTGGRFGLQTMCEGGGMANATILENVA
ncbi:MAG TPA: acetyl-CoA C-acetyltransferase [Acidimicrobiales bacterium]|nr:acetyl-CoA C-acetyltransferase [Acidimicrobiales bacterium]